MHGYVMLMVGSCFTWSGGSSFSENHVNLASSMSRHSIFLDVFYSGFQLLEIMRLLGSLFREKGH